MKLLISKKTGINYYADENKDYHTKEGYITKEDLNSKIVQVKSNKGVDFFKFEFNDYDKRKSIKRGPQIILPKDLGYILSRTGISKDSTVVEAGSGSGAATIFFSRFVKKVLSYEINDKHYEITKKNLEFANCDNVELSKGDLADHIRNLKDFDMLFLDMPDPSVILENEISGLKKGNYVVLYLPSITQIVNICKFVSDRDYFYVEEVSEIILRNWKVNERIARPEHRKETDHTAFLVFLRKF